MVEHSSGISSVFYTNHMLLIFQKEKPGKFQSNVRAFHRALPAHTGKVRGPFGIVQQSQQHGGKKQKIGDPGSILCSELKKTGYYDDPLDKASIAANSINVLQPFGAW
jgi:hypothetical protein